MSAEMGLLQRLVEWLFGSPRPRAPRSPNAPPPIRNSGPSAGAPGGGQPVSSGDGRSAPASTRRRENLAALNAEQFAPLERDEVREQADQLGSLWGNPWFGRRDLIPPAYDPRTQLIDRAMVGQGLLTPEDLVDIHRIGEEMDRVRPDLALAVAEADRAVTRSVEERAALKAEKKAAAAERRRLHAEGVAHRRATDIVFLGRGVSKGLAERTANVAALQQAGLPVLATPADVAAALSISIPRLRWLAFHSVATRRTHYVSFTVPKKSGGVRTLSSPHRSLARCQEWILRNIVDQVPVHAAAHGFVRGRSTLSGARPHVGAEVVLNVDLKDFFPTITFPRVKGVFQQLGYSPAAATILALLCTECPRRLVEYAGEKLHVATAERGLPQGACTSPGLSNLIVRRMDARLQGIATRLGWTYTRYADDMTFSTSGEAAQRLAYVMARIRHIAGDEGFALHAEKTRVQRPNVRQSVTGIVVNERAGVPRETVRRIRAILHRAKHEGLAAQNLDGIPHFEGWLRGMIAYIRMVNPQQGAPLQHAFDELMPSGTGR
jgi:retron-type reverse transcriptase